MGKNVLILSSSPRRGGNSDTLCDQFLLGAQEAGHEAEKIFLRDRKINYCLACNACQGNGGSCVQQDDMAEVLDKMAAADVVVLATPVYFYTMAAQMKTLIDRVYSRYTKLKNKDLYFIATAADGRQQALERTIEGFRGFADCLDGAKEKGVVYGAGAWNAGDIKKHPAMKQAYEMGKKV